MQLRMDATYKREWREFNTKFIGYASYRAHVIVKDGKLVFEDNNIWEKEKCAGNGYTFNQSNIKGCWNYSCHANQIIEELYYDAKAWELDTILQEPRNCYLYEKLGYVKTGQTKIINNKKGGLKQWRKRVW